MHEVVWIGRCKGCDEMARLEDGVCEGCLRDPRRGRRWAAVAHRCRVDRAFARVVHGMIDSDGGREVFRRMFGDPRVEG